MLQDIRNSTQSMTFKIIVGLIVVTFALFGVESIVGNMGGEPEVATVNGSDITEREFERAVETKRRQILSQMGDRADPDLIDKSRLRSSVLEGLIEEELLAQDASNKDLYVAEASINSYITNIDQFKVDGQFDNERMQMLLRNAGLTLKDYKDSLRKQFMLQQPRTALVASAFVLDQESNEIISIDRQARTFGSAIVSKASYIDAIAVNDEDVASFYETNRTDFKKPRSVDVTYVELRKADLKDDVDVSDEAIRALYAEEAAQFEGEEEREAAHILIKIDDETDEAAALARIKEIEAEIESGADFSKLAKEYSEDEGSAESGGNLGLSGRGVYVADFENTLFQLEEGQISEPVKTEFGYHLIKLLNVETNEMPALDEMRDALADRLKSEEVDALYASLSEQLADLSYSSPGLDGPADELGLEIKQLAGVSKETANPLFSDPKVQRVLFNEELVQDGLNSDLIEVDSGRAVVFRVDALHEESIRPLSEVKEKIRDILVDQKAAEFARSVGEAFIARIESGESPELVAEDMGIEWQLHEDVTRDNISLNREMLTQVFTIKLADTTRENVHGFPVDDGDYAVVMLQDVQPGDPTETTLVEKQAIRNMIGNGFGAGDYQNYKKSFENQAEIEHL